ncbi:MAG: LEA type 2 family protein [Candidatus Aminicenantes bacterium]|nr:LEA type 2 family protein [Candidatus Aminicenantes bacterium]
MYLEIPMSLSRTMSLFRRRSVPALAALALAAFPAAAGPFKDDLTVSNYERRVSDLSAQGLTLLFQIRIGNASARPCALTRYEYRVLINQAEYLRLDVPLDTPLRVAASGETLLSLPLKITYRLLFQAIPALADADKANCFLMGTFIFADERRREEKIPFTFGGEFPIFRDPGVALLPLRLKDLTVGGADAVFRVKLTNPNVYELFVDAVRFSAAFGEREVASGEIPGDKNVDPRGEKVFDLPTLISFFEVGQEVYGLLQAGAVNCRFRGEIDITTVWGRIKVPFDVRQNLPVSKPS